MDDNLQQNKNAQNKDARGDSFAGDNVTNESPRMNEVPVRNETLPMSENVSGLGNDSLVPEGKSLQEDSNQGVVEISAEVQDDLVEDFESYMDDNSL